MARRPLTYVNENGCKTENSFDGGDINAPESAFRPPDHNGIQGMGVGAFVNDDLTGCGTRRELS
jgi:hypothetical protein